jgi:hypothetical protein
MDRMVQNATLSNSFDKFINMYAILLQSGTRYAVAKEMVWLDVKV